VSPLAATCSSAKLEPRILSDTPPRRQSEDQRGRIKGQSRKAAPLTQKSVHPHGLRLRRLSRKANRFSMLPANLRLPGMAAPRTSCFACIDQPTKTASTGCTPSPADSSFRLSPSCSSCPSWTAPPFRVFVLSCFRDPRSASRPREFPPHPHSTRFGSVNPQSPWHRPHSLGVLSGSRPPFSRFRPFAISGSVSQPRAFPPHPPQFSICILQLAASLPSSFPRVAQELTLILCSQSAIHNTTDCQSAAHG
jgi:hypothetical protein